MKCITALVVLGFVLSSSADDYIERFDSSPSTFGAVVPIDSCTGPGEGVDLQGGVVESPKRGDAYLPGLGGLTVAAWVWLDSASCGSTQCPIVVNADEDVTNDPLFGIFYRPGDNRFVCKSGSSEVAVPAKLDEWTHVACVFVVSFLTVRAYVNFRLMESTIKLIATAGGRDNILIGGYIDSGRTIISDPLLGKVALVQVLPGFLAIDDHSVFALGCYQAASTACPADYVCLDATPNPLQVPTTESPVVGGTVSPQATPSPSISTSIPDTPAPEIFSTYSPNELPNSEKLVLAVESSSPSPPVTVAPFESSYAPSTATAPTDLSEGSEAGGDELPQFIVFIACMSVLVVFCVWAILRSRSPPQQPTEVEDAASASCDSPPLSPVSTNRKLLGV